MTFAISLLLLVLVVMYIVNTPCADCDNDRL